MARKIIVVANFPVKNEGFIAYAQNVVTCWTGNALFPNPPVTLAAVTALINSLISAQALALKKGVGAATARNTARAKVEAALRQLEAYAEGIVVQMAPEDGAAALATTGFPSKKPSKHTKAPYSVLAGTLAGTAEIDLKAQAKTGKVMYCHQYSLDAGKTWLDWPPTVEVKTTVTGLPSGLTVLFRYRTLIKGVYGNWSQTMSVPVH